MNSEEVYALVMVEVAEEIEDMMNSFIKPILNKFKM